jgi:hypothetical protein
MGRRNVGFLVILERLNGKWPTLAWRNKRENFEDKGHKNVTKWFLVLELQS